MPHLACYTLNALAALSLLLCVATVALWVRSYWRSDRLTLIVHTTLIAHDTTAYIDCPPWKIDVPEGIDHLRYRRLFVTSGGGFILLATYQRSSQGPVGDRVYYSSSTEITTGMRHADENVHRYHPYVRLPGLYAFDDPYARAIGPARCLLCRPAWPAALAAILPAWQFSSYLRRRRRREATSQGCLCRYCNYDLRATPDRCPECGAVPAASRR